jgi:hypothetical protein
MKRFFFLVIAATILTTSCKKVVDLLKVKAFYTAGSFYEINCDQLGAQASQNSLDSVNITFTNNSKRELHINWIDYTGHEVTYHDLADGASWDCPTFLTHPWIIRKTDGACSTILIPKMGAASHETVSFGQE